MSFFADLLGGAALTGEKILGDRIDQKQALERQDHESALQEARARTTEAMKIKMQEDARQALRQRTAEQNAAVEEQAPAVTRARELASATQRAPSVDGNVLDTIKARLSPEQVSKYYGVDSSPVAAIDDRLGIARKGAMFEAEDMLQAARKETVSALDAARKAADNERRLDQGDAKIDATLRGQDQATARVLAAIAGRSEVAAAKTSKTAAAVEKLTTQKSLTLREITELREAGGSKTELAKNPDYIDAQARLKRINALLSDKWEKDVNEDSAAPAAAPKPGTAKPTAPGGMTAIGKTPDGRIVYKTADGKQVVGK